MRGCATVKDLRCSRTFNINQSHRLPVSAFCALHSLAFRVEVCGDGVSEGAEFQSSLVEGGGGASESHGSEKTLTWVREFPCSKTRSKIQLCFVIYGVIATQQHRVYCCIVKTADPNLSRWFHEISWYWSLFHYKWRQDPHLSWPQLSAVGRGGGWNPLPTRGSPYESGSEWSSSRQWEPCTAPLTCSAPFLLKEDTHCMRRHISSATDSTILDRTRGTRSLETVKTLERRRSGQWPSARRYKKFFCLCVLPQHELWWCSQEPLSGSFSLLQKEKKEVHR